jgi:kynurenine formamidase
MPVLNTLLDGLRDTTIELIDLTAPLSDATPEFAAPNPLPSCTPFTLREVSRYDERGPRWYWNDIIMGEHTGTHLCAPVHWVTGKDLDDVAAVPIRKIIAPAAVLDFSKEAQDDPDFLLEKRHVMSWQEANGPLPDKGWLLFRTGWDARISDRELFLNADVSGAHTPGLSVECARWLAEESSIIGVGAETLGTDAGMAHSFDPPYPCCELLLGAGKYGLVQLQNLGRLPSQGAVLVVSPLPISGGSGSPARVLALVESP